MTSILRHAVGAATLLAAAIALAACAASGDPGSSPVATDRVDMPRSYRFAPADITVPAGTTVTWTNSDNFTHSVHVEGREDQVVPPGESTAITFEAPGLFAYTCTFHSTDMNGTVTVTEP
jgi:plastocyanin